MFSLDTKVYDQNYSKRVNEGLQTGNNLRSLIEDKKERDRKEKLKELQKASTIKGEDGSQVFDRQTYLSNLKNYDPSEYDRQKSEYLKQDHADWKNQLGTAVSKTQYLSDALSSVTDQKSWERVLQDADKNGIEEAKDYMGTPYDPNLIKRLQMNTLSYQDQLNEMARQKELGLKERGADRADKQFEFGKKDADRKFGFAKLQHKDKMGLGYAQLEQKKRESELKNNPQKGKELTPSMVKKINEGNQIPAMLEDIKKTINDNKKVFGPVRGNLASMNPYDEKVQTIDAQMRASSQAFGRYMEGGVLRKEDEEKYRKMFPKLGDTPEVAANKLAIVSRLLQQKQQSDLDAFRSQGYNLEGLDKGYDMPDAPNVLAGGETKVPGIDNANAQADGLDNLTDEDLAKLLQKLEGQGQ